MATPIPDGPDVLYPQPLESKDEDVSELTAPLVKKQTLPHLEIESTAELPTVTAESSILEELSSVDRLMVSRRLQVKSVLCLRGKKNRFFVKTPDQTLMYTIEEENSWWVGYFCYGLRPLQLKVKNEVGTEVMRIVRPFKMSTRFLPCQTQVMHVFSPPGCKIGCVKQKWTAVKPLYVVKNVNDDVLFWIRGPSITISCFRDVQFEIMRPDGTHVGATCKRWQGLVHAVIFAAVRDKYGVAFEMDLSSEEKALLLAASLLLDYMYYDM